MIWKSSECRVVEFKGESVFEVPGVEFHSMKTKDIISAMSILHENGKTVEKIFFRPQDLRRLRRSKSFSSNFLGTFRSKMLSEIDKSSTVKGYFYSCAVHQEKDIDKDSFLMLGREDGGNRYLLKITVVPKKKLWCFICKKNLTIPCDHQLLLLEETNNQSATIGKIVTALDFFPLLDPGQECVDRILDLRKQFAKKVQELRLSGMDLQRTRQELKETKESLEVQGKILEIVKKDLDKRKARISPSGDIYLPSTEEILEGPEIDFRIVRHGRLLRNGIDFKISSSTGYSGVSGPSGATSSMLGTPKKHWTERWGFGTRIHKLYLMLKNWGN